ncbi:hypothetical protein KC865_03545 [Candidatus Kaiserbacteria bacterium]|nr:hypothetical protein [Candidatus Kaiserbacteria bacterium]USN92531.1 MAG: hypothetical protein H6782_01815 [Candidatus Nomurabacteria bacterium]
MFNLQEPMTLEEAREGIRAGWSQPGLTGDERFFLEQAGCILGEENAYFTYESEVPIRQRGEIRTLDDHPNGAGLAFLHWAKSGAPDTWGSTHGSAERQETRKRVCPARI